MGWGPFGVAQSLKIDQSTKPASPALLAYFYHIERGFVLISCLQSTLFWGNTLQRRSDTGHKK
jgi:hypothetical protein